MSEATENLPAVRQESYQLMPAERMSEVLTEWADRRKQFRQWLLSQLTQGVHYGIPPGCAPKVNGRGEPIDDRGCVIPPEQWTFKPGLYKAGADFICNLMRMRPTFEPDTVTWEMLGKKTGTAYIVCRLVNDGSPFFPDKRPDEILGEGRGAAQAGTKRRDDNGAIKIAQKSAKVDAVINTLGLSDLFTQDLETLPEATDGARSRSEQIANKVAAKAVNVTQLASQEQLTAIYGLRDAMAEIWPGERWNNWAGKMFDAAGVDSWEKMPDDKIQACIDRLKGIIESNKR